MGEVELRREQQSRAPTVGALGDAGAIAEAEPALRLWTLAENLYPRA